MVCGCAQLHVMDMATEECLHWGPIGGSVINALHFGRDNRGVNALQSVPDLFIWQL